MSTRATARHRASLRPATPLSTLSKGMSDGVGTIGRGGVVIAMSSGLVATLGLPAQAVSAAKAESGPATAPVATLALQDGLTANSASALTADATATITFERAAFTPAPASAKPKAAAKVTPSGKSNSGQDQSDPPPGGSVGSSVLSVAARYLGVPYVYGGDSPSGWDCSGATKYIFAQVGITLPRTSAAQLSSTTRVSASDAKPGDLVFFFSGGRVYHVGIYAGGGMIYDSGRTGSVFSKRAIWSSNVAYTRVTG